jgi:uncharacterized integral membrane protein
MPFSSWHSLKYNFILFLVLESKKKRTWNLIIMLFFVLLLLLFFSRLNIDYIAFIYSSGSTRDFYGLNKLAISCERASIHR